MQCVVPRVQLFSVDAATARDVSHMCVWALLPHLLCVLSCPPTYLPACLSSGLTTADFGWGSPMFAKMGRKKINLISTFLKLDVQVSLED